MKFARALSVALLAAFTVSACDDSSTGIEIADLAGFWTATEFAYNDQTGDFPGFGIDAVSAAVGGTITLDVTENGSFAGTLRVPGLTVNPATGETLTVDIGGTITLMDQSNISIDFDAATEQLGFFGDLEAPFTLNGDVFRFTNDDATFDYPDAIELQVIGVARDAVAVELVAEFTRN